MFGNATKSITRALLGADRYTLLRERFQQLHMPKNRGYCVICERQTLFVEHSSWLRDNYRCRRCGTIPRNRALVNALNRFRPEWRTLALHESSPGGATSQYLKEKCARYTSSHFFADVPRGSFHDGH